MISQARAVLELEIQMQQSESLREFSHRVEKGVYRSGVINYVLSLLLLALLVWGAVSWWQNRVNISDARVVGESALCSGDSLTIAFTLHVNNDGILIRDASTQRVSPPKTIIFSDWLRFPIKGPVDERIVVAWRVPKKYADFETGRLVALPPGEYLRNIAVSSLSGRDDTDMESIPFSIREDCED